MTDARRPIADASPGVGEAFFTGMKRLLPIWSNYYLHLLIFFMHFSLTLPEIFSRLNQKRFASHSQNIRPREMEVDTE